MKEDARIDLNNMINIKLVSRLCENYV